MYRYDWYIVPEVYDKKVKTDKVVGEFQRILTSLDNSYIKKNCADIGLTVIRDGAYYGYLVENSDGSVMLQALPAEYCRSRYSIGNIPVVEMNMKFFDDKFPDVQYRMRVLQLFPKDFQKGYYLYKNKQLTPDFQGDSGKWYALEPGQAWKFSFDNGDIPLFVNAIPAIIDLDNAIELDRKKQMQKLLKIIVQKLPTDKNGELLFDIDEATDIHRNAVEMLANAIGVDVLTTFTDVDAVNISDSTTATSTDDLEKSERAVFNSTGISQNLFNTDGNLSLEKSVLNDEGYCRTLLLQFAAFYDHWVQSKATNKKKYNFRLYMLETTQYNYKDLSKMYKEQVQMGYSKMLPQIALGHSQSFIISSCYFENEILKLHEVMIPPMLSSTMNSETILGKTGNSSSSKSQNNIEGDKEGGRPPKEEGELSEKTIANRESMS